jgi:hypothetical protein
MSDGVKGADSEGGGAGTTIKVPKAEVFYRKTVTRGSSSSQGRTTFSEPVPLDERDKETLDRCWHEPRYVVSKEEDRERGVIHRGYYVPHEGGVLEVLVRKEGRIILRDPEDGTAVGFTLRGAEMLAMAMLDSIAVFEKSKGEV